MIYLFVTLHVLVSIFLVLVVLLQQGKGADLSVFGGGATMTAFGARGAATLLHKLTVIGFVLFIVTTIGIGIFESSKSQSSVMGDLPAAETPAPQPTTPATSPAPAATAPTAAEPAAPTGAEAAPAEAPPPAEAAPSEAPQGTESSGGTP